MSKLNDVIKEEQGGGSSYSKATDAKIHTTFLNDVDYKSTRYVKKGDSFATVESYPARDFREAIIADVAKEAELDAAETQRVIKETKFGKKAGEASAAFTNAAVKAYLATGKNYVLDANGKDECKTVLSTKEVESKTVETTMIAKGDDGSYSVKPTGDVVTYDKVRQIAAKNSYIEGLNKSKKKAK